MLLLIPFKLTLIYAMDFFQIFKVLSESWSDFCPELRYFFFHNIYIFILLTVMVEIIFQQVMAVLNVFYKCKYDPAITLLLNELIHLLYNMPDFRNMPLKLCVFPLIFKSK